MDATVPSVMLSPMLGTATVTSFQLATLPLIPRPARHRPVQPLLIAETGLAQPEAPGVGHGGPHQAMSCDVCAMIHPSPKRHAQTDIIRHP